MSSVQGEGHNPAVFIGSTDLSPARGSVWVILAHRNWWLARVAMWYPWWFLTRGRPGGVHGGCWVATSDIIWAIPATEVVSLKHMRK